MSAPYGCHGCGTPITQPRRGRRKWCSERCRRAQYAGECEQCGAPTNGHGGPGKAPRLCRRCASAASGAARKRWTRETLINAIQAWADKHGEPPAIPDWSPTAAREINDPDRIGRYLDDGYWPNSHTVIREFGSWNAGIIAAGFEARAAHGGDGNERRRRSLRVAA